MVDESYVGLTDELRAQLLEQVRRLLAKADSAKFVHETDAVEGPPDGNWTTYFRTGKETFTLSVWVDGVSAVQRLIDKGKKDDRS